MTIFHQGITERSDLVLIWSGEHNAWWRAKGRGYTRSGKQEGLLSAGVYEREDAEKWISGCGPEKEVKLVPLINLEVTVESGSVLDYLLAEDCE